LPLLLVAVLIGYCPRAGAGPGEGHPVAFGLLVDPQLGDRR
jgi:hypothetical protein